MSCSPSAPARALLPGAPQVSQPGSILPGRGLEMRRRLLASLGVAMLLFASLVVPAFAGDHLANGAGSPGATQRGFANPVAANPSGTSGAAATPGTVPGEGNPSAGLDLGTPSVDLAVVNTRSGGNGTPAKP